MQYLRDSPSKILYHQHFGRYLHMVYLLCLLETKVEPYQIDIFAHPMETVQYSWLKCCSNCSVQIDVHESVICFTRRECFHTLKNYVRKMSIYDSIHRVRPHQSFEVFFEFM